MNSTNSNATNETVQHLIENINDLITFRGSVNNGKDFRNEVVIQNCDIEELKNWVPIGTLDRTFCGT